MLALGESRLKQAALLDTEDALQKTLQVRDEAKAHVLHRSTLVRLCSVLTILRPIVGNMYCLVNTGATKTCLSLVGLLV